MGVTGSQDGPIRDGRCGHYYYYYYYFKSVSKICYASKYFLFTYLITYYYYYYYYYYAAFNAPCVGHKDDESQVCCLKIRLLISRQQNLMSVPSNRGRVRGSC